VSRFVLVQLPFFRLLGSHNDRGPLDLAYLAGHLAAEHDVAILNLDYSGSKVFCSWGDLFMRSGLIANALEPMSPILLEAAERILGQKPTHVVLSAGDSLTPWVDLGNAFVASRLARVIRGISSVRIYAVGPRVRDLPDAWRVPFDADALTAPELLALLTRDLIGDLHSAPATDPVTFYSCPPRFDLSEDASTYDVLMTALGCPRSCTFCDARHSVFRTLPMESISADIAARNCQSLDIGDSVFLPSVTRAAELKAAFRENGFSGSLACEMTIEHVTPARMEALADLGVTELKVGVEAADEATLARMGKRSSAKAAVAAARLAREYGFRLTAYVLLGGPICDPVASAHKTLELCRELAADSYVVNVWAYDQPVSVTDCHFSWDLVCRYGLQDVIHNFLTLPCTKPNLGEILDYAREEPAKVENSGLCTPSRTSTSPPRHT
jgi:hypothetical protein